MFITGTKYWSLLMQARRNGFEELDKVCGDISGGLRQAFITVQTTCHRKFMVYFADKKSTTGFCFVSCYCIVDETNK